MKCIPSAPKEMYMKQLMTESEKFIKRLRWKMCFHKSSFHAKQRENYYGFKTEKTPPSDPDLDGFEKDVYLMIKNLKWDSSKHQNELEREMRQDLKNQLGKKNLAKSQGEAI